MTHLVFAKGKLLERNMRNRRPFMSASNLETASYTTRHVSKVFADTPHWQIIEIYWNTAM
jgi:hypothetical protein